VDPMEDSFPALWSPLGDAPVTGEDSQKAGAREVSNLCRSESLSMKGDAPISGREHEDTAIIHGARLALGPRDTANGLIRIAGGRIDRIQTCTSSQGAAASGAQEIDLTGFLVMPGLINAHDHLGLALFPRMAASLYPNYIAWGEDIHNNFPQEIAKHHTVTIEDRLLWGGIRNLLCGVTSVSHHDPVLPTLERADFPVRIVRQNGWAHSLALTSDLLEAHTATLKGRAFVLHACEGVDQLAQDELWELDSLGLLDSDTVLVHGLAIDRQGVALMNARHASLIVCPSSNYFLYGKLPDLALLGEIERVALGNDSPVSAEGDLLDEIRFAVERCGISSERVYRMVTTIPAQLLRLENAEGTIKESGVADFIAVRDTGGTPADTLQTLSMQDIEFVMIGGRVQLASEPVFEMLPISKRNGLESLSIGPVIRWLRAPVVDLLQKTEEVLGKDEVQLGSRPLSLPAYAEAQHAR
jgi:cytosine/adenosine deaminase-related metal-dependent hydrolase